MAMPESRLSHPRGYANPVVLRASAVLAAAGAWDAAPTESPSAFVDDLTLYFTYTQGGQNPGAFDWQLEVSAYAVAALVPAGASEWVTESVYDAGVVAVNTDTQSRVQREYQTYGATAAGAEDFVFGPIVLNGTVERIRVRARESADGDVANPGTLSVVAEMM